MANNINSNASMLAEIKALQEYANKRQKGSDDLHVVGNSNEGVVLKRKSTQPKAPSNLHSNLAQHLNYINEANENINQWTSNPPRLNISAPAKKTNGDFEKWLNIWAQSQKSGNVKEAVKRISEAFYSEATELYLDHLELTSLPSVISQLSKLKVLNLEANRFQTFPIEVLALTELEDLALASNHLQTIPAAISKLSKLRILHLCFNELWHLPDEMSALSELVFLDLNNNSLSELPSTMGKLSKLKTLDISYNQLRRLRDELRHLSQLECFHFSENPLGGIPTWISGFSKLRLLGAERIRISYFPVELCNLPLLEELYLSDNELEDLPSALGNLQSLIILELSHNCLVTVPKEVGKLKKLARLDVEGNQTLFCLPKELGGCTNLARINCTGTVIPQDVADRVLAQFKKETAAAPYAEVTKLLDRLNAEERGRRIQALFQNPFQRYSPFEELNNYLKFYSPLNYK